MSTEVASLATSDHRLRDMVGRLQRTRSRSVSAATLLTAGDDVVRVDTAGAGVTVTLPPAATHYGKEFYIKKTNAGANNVTIDGNASETIDGAATLVFNTQWMTKHIVSNGVSWDVL